MNRTELRALALAANVPDHNENPAWYLEEDLLLDGVYYAKNARFIAAASPDVVLGLLNALERKDQLLKQALDLLNMGFDYSGDVYGVRHNDAVDITSTITKELAPQQPETT